MEKKKIESILVFGDSTVGNPDLRYVVGASLARGGIYVQRRSHDPTLIVSNIDVGSARLGRVRKIRRLSDYGIEVLSGKDEREEARARFYQKSIKDIGASGPILLAGRNETSNSLLLIDSLRMKGIKVVGEKTPTILEVAKETKERREIEKLREMGKKTSKVVEKTLQFLSKAKPRGTKITIRSKPLTVHPVKRAINGLLAEEGIIAPEDTIFAPGRKSSDPHYDGKGGDIIRTGEPIVFDIFPSEPDGYWHDCTRTYSFGSPQKKLKEMYDAVLEAQTTAIDMVRAQASCSETMIQVFKLFENKCYLTHPSPIKGDNEAT